MKKILLSLFALLSVAGAWAATAITSVADLKNTSAYTIKSVSRGFLFHDATKPGYVCSSTQTTSAIVDATPANDGKTPIEQFAFLRTENTPASQYYLYNMGVGKYVTSSGNEGVIEFTDTPKSTWSVTVHGSYFLLHYLDRNNTTICVTGWAPQGTGCKLAINASIDDGNKMTITEVLTGATFAEQLAAIEKYEVSILKANATTALNLIGLGYPASNAQERTVLSNAINNTETTYAQLQTALDNYYACTNVELPISGKAYTINAWWPNGTELPMTFFASKEEGVYTGYDNGYAPKEGATAVKFACQEVDGKSLFVSDNGYYLGWQADGKENNCSQTYNADQLLGLVKAYISTSEGSAQDNVAVKDLFGKFCLQSTDGHNLMFSLSTKKYHNGNPGSTYCSNGAHTVYFALAEASDYTTNVLNVNTAATMKDGSYVATYFAPYAVALPDGYKAYTINEVGNGKAYLTQVEGDVPSNTGVIITAPSSGQVTLGLSTANSASIADNRLLGSVTDAYVAGDAYVLAKGTGGVGLYKAELDKDADGNVGNSHFKNNAGKAYLPASAITYGARYFVFDFETETGIENIEGAENVNGNVAIYNLSGRRIQNAQKGIYIVNGKKLIK